MPSLEATFRHREILEELHRDGRVEVGRLATRFGVSCVTIRTDLDYLEQQGLLRRIRGGAVPAESKRFELPLEETRQVHAREKESIGNYAAGLVRDGETILLDVGSTTTELARALSPSLKNVVVITSALNIALLLESHPGITVIVTGGTLRPLQHSLVNPLRYPAFARDQRRQGFPGLQRGTSGKRFHQYQPARSRDQAGHDRGRPRDYRAGRPQQDHAGGRCPHRAAGGCRSAYHRPQSQKGGPRAAL